MRLEKANCCLQLLGRLQRNPLMPVQAANPATQAACAVPTAHMPRAAAKPSSVAALAERRTSCSTRGLRSLAHALTTTYSRLCFSRALYTLDCRPRPMISWMLGQQEGRTRWAAARRRRRSVAAAAAAATGGNRTRGGPSQPAGGRIARAIERRHRRRTRLNLREQAGRQERPPHGSLVVIHSAVLLITPCSSVAGAPKALKRRADPSSGRPSSARYKRSPGIG